MYFSVLRLEWVWRIYLLTGLKLFEVEYTLPGVVEGIHKIPTSALVKGLTWLRTRASIKDDPYFAEFHEEFLYALQEEIPIADAGQSSLKPPISYGY